ncbi:unnamed protein product [Polarella glacialis]|uniref:Membrane protein insertion efficiency factor n=1 Tax=Polarella glacialis TaxID=89957 RepID=A0A813K8T3_POLGL|nr:unnamed protein product [Polarella glacialis]
MRGSGGQAASTPEPGDEDNEAVDRRSEESVAQQVLLSGLRLYRTYVSPLLPPNCRFVPSCSRYGIESVKRYGAWEGLLLFIWRVLRCSPLAPVDKSKIVWANNRFCVADDPEIWHSKLFAPGSSGCRKPHRLPSIASLVVCIAGPEKAAADTLVSCEQGASLSQPAEVGFVRTDYLVAEHIKCRKLFDLCDSKQKLFVSPADLGHNADMLSDPEFLVRPILSLFALPDYSFEEIRVPPEAFDKTLCPLYHGLVELTRHDGPLRKLDGDDEEPSCDVALDTPAADERELGELEEGFHRWPPKAQEPFENGLPGLNELDIDSGISRFLDESMADLRLPDEWDG